jgi:hypothetical protein
VSVSARQSSTCGTAFAVEFWIAAVVLAVLDDLPHLLGDVHHGVRAHASSASPSSDPFDAHREHLHLVGPTRLDLARRLADVPGETAPR